MLRASDLPVYLRALEPTDLERVHRWHNDPALYASLTGQWRPASTDTEREWLAAATRPSATAWSFAICVADGDAHVGNALLRDVEPVHRHAELHLLIGEAAARGRGYGQAAADLLLGFAFDHLGLERVWLQVLASNEAALRLYEGRGFAAEGTLRRHAFNAGRWEDVVVMGRLRD